MWSGVGMSPWACTGDTKGYDCGKMRHGAIGSRGSCTRTNNIISPPPTLPPPPPQSIESRRKTWHFSNRCLVATRKTDGQSKPEGRGSLPPIALAVCPRRLSRLPRAEIKFDKVWLVQLKRATWLNSHGSSQVEKIAKQRIWPWRSYFEH